MGLPMARNILKAGHRLTVWDLRLGATRARDLRSLAQTARVTCTSLPNDAIVQAVVLGEAGREGCWPVRETVTSSST